jgi:hypothetical protein
MTRLEDFELPDPVRGVLSDKTATRTGRGHQRYLRG